MVYNIWHIFLECGGASFKQHSHLFRGPRSIVTSDEVISTMLPTYTTAEHNLSSSSTLKNKPNIFHHPRNKSKEDNLDEWEFTSESFTSSQDSSRLSLFNEDKKRGCYPIFPLARIKYATDFTDTFLIQVSIRYIIIFLFFFFLE